MGVSLSEMDENISLEQRVQKLWKKTSSDGSSLQPWVEREFYLSVKEKNILYLRKDKSAVYISLTEDCIVQDLANKFYGRKNCLRLLWSAGHDLIISASNESIMLEWRDLLYRAVTPNDTRSFQIFGLRDFSTRKISTTIEKFHANKSPIIRNNLNIKSSSVFYKFQYKIDNLLLDVGIDTNVNKKNFTNIQTNNITNSNHIKKLHKNIPYDNNNVEQLYIHNNNNNNNIELSYRNRRKS